MNYNSAGGLSFYNLLPFFLKNAMASVYGARQRKARYGPAFKRCIDFLAASDYWPNERVRQHQWLLLNEFLPSAIEDTGYYNDKKVYRDYVKHRRFEDLPILSKSEVKSNLEQLRSKRLHAMPHRWAHTSGTTGKSLVFPIELACFQREYAYKAFHYRWGGVDPTHRDRIAFCQGHPVAHIDRATPPFWVYDWANNNLLLSSYHLSETNMAAYIRELERFQPIMISGYPSSLYLLAAAYLRHGNAGLSVRSIYTTSETLFSHQRKMIESAFGCRVYDAYGNTEMCANIVECEERELHLRLDHSLVEIVNNECKQCGPGETGRLVCTNFSNRAFPLIRYDIGDTVTISERQSSKCGRGGVLIDKIIGRVEDYVVTSDGRAVGRLDHLFKDSKNVIEAQIVQKRVGEVILLIVKGGSFSYEDEQNILREARLRLGSAMNVRFEYVEKIPRTKNGKFRFVDSQLDQGRILEEFAASPIESR